LLVSTSRWCCSTAFLVEVPSRTYVWYCRDILPFHEFQHRFTSLRSIVSCFARAVCNIFVIVLYDHSFSTFVLRVQRNGSSDNIFRSDKLQDATSSIESLLSRYFFSEPCRRTACHILPLSFFTLHSRFSQSQTR
jgi:hypothetical protein